MQKVLFNMIGFSTIGSLVKKGAAMIEPVIKYCPKKLSGLLSKDTFIFSHNPKNPLPQGYILHAKKLKTYYKNKGIHYLLPHEEWSDDKIFATIKSLGKKLDKLVKSKKLNKQTLQKAVDEMVPKAKGKIIIKDFADLENDLRAMGYEENIIQHYLSSTALTSSNPKQSELYFKFENALGDPFEKIQIKLSIEHEMQHALSSRFQNTSAIDRYKNNSYKCSNQQEIFNKIFGMFERENCQCGTTAEQTELTQKNMLNWFGFNSTEELHKNFEEIIDRLIKEAKVTGKLNLGERKREWKQFFNYLKNASKDEREAYRSNIRYREFYKDSKTPVTVEFKSLLYGEMEKFFAKKRIEVNSWFQQNQGIQER